MSMDHFRFAGYRVMEFSSTRKDALKEIAERLLPHEQSILDAWVKQQCASWQPPGLTIDELRDVFSRLLRSILSCMDARELEICISDLSDAGAELAQRQFPFEALVISVHFLEKSYLPYLLTPPSNRTGEWLIGMDEFLHAALASVSTAYFEAYRRELLDRAEVGRLVQEGLLAHIPRRAGDLEIAHVYISARERAQVGGDFLDSFGMGPDKVAFIIGDLSGHGLEAAADSVMLRSLFRGFMREHADLTDAMGRLNRVLESELQAGQFATALAVVYDMSGELGLVSAGNPLPVICDHTSCRQIESTGPALTIDGRSVYTMDRVILPPGGVFVAHTDGLTEARDGRDFYGEERVMQAVNAVRDGTARDIADHLIDESVRHAGGRFVDDVALLILKRRA